MCSSASWTPSLWLDLSLCLSRTLLLILLVNAHAEVLGLGHKVLVLGEYGGAVPDLTISQPHGVPQLGGQGDLVILKSTNCVLTLLNLAVLGLKLELLFGGVGIIESTGEGINWQQRWPPRPENTGNPMTRDRVTTLKNRTG